MSDNEPRVPSAFELERSVSAFQQLRAMYAADPQLADDENIIATALADAEITQPEVLLDRAIDAVVWAMRREVEADDLRREMTSRRDRYRARILMIRTMIEQLLVATEKTSHRAKLGRAGMVKGQPSLVVTDEQLLPEKYFRTERILMRTPLQDDLEQGEVIDGAVLSNAVPHLQIRRL